MCWRSDFEIWNDLFLAADDAVTSCGGIKALGGNGLDQIVGHQKRGFFVQDLHDKQQNLIHAILGRDGGHGVDQAGLAVQNR